VGGLFSYSHIHPLFSHSPALFPFTIHHSFRAIREFEPLLPVIIMTAFRTTETAIEATQTGDFDYMLKPFNIPEMLALVEKAMEAGRFMRSRVELDVIPETGSGEAIIGRSRGHAGSL
jgi:two-component system nitrogen regulation response regulator GlnG